MILRGVNLILIPIEDWPTNLTYCGFEWCTKNVLYIDWTLCVVFRLWLRLCNIHWFQLCLCRSSCPHLPWSKEFTVYTGGPMFQHQWNCKATTKERNHSISAESWIGLFSQRQRELFVKLAFIFTEHQLEQKTGSLKWLRCPRAKVPMIPDGNFLHVCWNMCIWIEYLISFFFCLNRNCYIGKVKSFFC